MHQRSIAEFGLRIAVDTHPFHNASYVLSVRQYRTLQSRFLQSMVHTKRPCDLLNFRDVTPAVKGLSPSGNNEHTFACYSKNLFAFFNYYCSLRKRVLLLMQSAHSVYNSLLFTCLLAKIPAEFSRVRKSLLI